MNMAAGHLWEELLCTCGCVAVCVDYLRDNSAQHNRNSVPGVNHGYNMWVNKLQLARLQHMFRDKDDEPTRCEIWQPQPLQFVFVTHLRKWLEDCCLLKPTGE